VAMRLKDLSNVVGYDSLNEPGSGFIGLEDLNKPARGLLMMGESPTPFQAMLLGAGYPQTVDIYELGFQGPQVTGQKTLNPDGLRVWREGYDCVWKQNGIWADEGGQPRLLRPDHFAMRNGQPIDIANDYIKPFIRRFITEIREIHPDALLFLEGVPGGEHPHWKADDPPQVVNAAHWYDGITLITKQFNPDFTVNFATGEPVMGAEAVAQAFIDQLAQTRHNGDVANDGAGIPTLVGEFGIPYDLDNKSAYTSGDFSTHEYALDLYYDAMDANLLNCTIWNYTPDNSNERGDLWNDEDLSIFSRDQQDTDWREDVHSGGRGLKAIVRPYARKIAGQPLRMTFDMNTRVFEFEFQPDSSVGAPTEIFVPTYQYPDGYSVELSSGSYTIDRDGQMLIVQCEHGSEACKVRVRPVE
jgi:hypothetical protein